MVSVAQSVEPRIVIPVVVGSSPIVHPIYIKHLTDIYNLPFRSCAKIRDHISSVLC
jgi:hypothetical protein